MQIKRKNRFLCLVISTLFIFLYAISSLYGLFDLSNKKESVSVSADYSGEYPLADDIYEIRKGASISTSCTALSFGVRLKKPNYRSAKTTEDYATYSFMVYRLNQDGVTSIPVSHYVIYSRYNYRIIAYKDLIYHEESSFSFSPVQKGKEDISDDSLINSLALSNDYHIYSATINDDNDYDFLSLGDSTDSNLLRFVIRCNSPYVSYFVRFQYEIKRFVEWDYGFLWLTKDPVYDTYSGTLDSSSRSISEVLTKMKEAGTLETEISNPDLLENANTILNNKDLKRIQVKYLTQIGDTPFATHNYAYVEVPVSSTSVPVDTVASALQVSNFNVLGCSCTGFEYDSASDIYVAKYLKNVWLSAKTVDGNSANYFLDCNLSYQDYYYQFVRDSVFSNDLYEYIFSQMLNKYPALRNKTDGGATPYTYDEVYGYFGYVVIPDTYNLNALWSEMFDTKTTFQGTIRTFEYNELLQHSAYQKLLDEYQYTWLEKVWNGVVGFVTGGSWSATHYLFYVESGVTESMIAENAADDIFDNSGLITNKVEDGIDIISGFISEKTSGWKVFFGVLSGCLMIVAVLWVLQNIKKLFSKNKK